MSVRWRVGLFSFAMLLAACGPLVPAQVPPQLSEEPGIFVVISDEQVETPAYRLSYPAGWRVVKTSLADAPVELVFVSADEALSIRVSETQPESVPAETGRVRIETEAELGGARRLYLIGDAPADMEASLQDRIMQMRDSLQANDQGQASD